MNFSDAFIFLFFILPIIICYIAIAYSVYLKVMYCECRTANKQKVVEKNNYTKLIR